MNNWRDRGTCRRLPDWWWETGDDGNRLALMICNRACPVRAWCDREKGQPAGWIFAGTAYSDRGDPLDLCACGRPAPRRNVHQGRCQICAPTVPAGLADLIRPARDREDYLRRKARRLVEEQRADWQAKKRRQRDRQEQQGVLHRSRVCVGELRPDLVEAAVAGETTPLLNRAERVAAVTQLAGWGYSDGQIGARLWWFRHSTPSTVGAFRRRHGIPAGVPCTRKQAAA